MAAGIDPDVALIDCLLRTALTLTKSAGFRTVALVHAIYSHIGGAVRARLAPGKPYIVASLSTGYQAVGQIDMLQRVCGALRVLDVEAAVTTGRGIDPQALRNGASSAERFLADVHVKERARRFAVEVAAEPGAARAVRLIETLRVHYRPLEMPAHSKQT